MEHFLAGELDFVRAEQTEHEAQLRDLHAEHEEQEAQLGAVQDELEAVGAWSTSGPTRSAGKSMPSPAWCAACRSSPPACSPTCLLAEDRAKRRTKSENANEIPCSNLVLGRLVGSGAFAEVRVGKWKGQDVATRRLHGAWSPQESNDFKAEAAIQQQL